MNKLEITPGFILLLSYLTFHDNMFIMFIIAAVLHELAHIAVTVLLGGSLSSCRLSIVGAYIRVDGLSYEREIIAVAAGPIVSLIAALITSQLDLYMLAGINLSLGIFNLFPARDLDGGRLAELLFMRQGIPPHGILSILNVASVLILATPLVIAFVNGMANYTLAIFVTYLILGEIYGQLTHARTKARTLYGRRNRERFKRVTRS